MIIQWSFEYSSSLRDIYYQTDSSSQYPKTKFLEYRRVCFGVRERMLKIPIKRKNQGIVVKNAEFSISLPNLVRSKLVQVINSLGPSFLLYEMKMRLSPTSWVWGRIK